MTEYAKILLAHVKKLAELGDRKRELDDQMDKLKALVRATYELMDEKEKAVYSDEVGGTYRAAQSLMHEVRSVLIREGGFLTPTQIRDRLVKSGYNFSRYESNPLVSIHSTLNRIKNELEIVTLEEGTKEYRFRRNAARNRNSR
jgi:hypothetical protein